MSLSKSATIMMKSLAKRGDYLAQAVTSEGITAFVTVSNPRVSEAQRFAAETLSNAANALTIANQPDVPRNAIVVFDASWDGGNVTITGTDQFGTVISEAFTSTPGSSVTGSKCFKTITGIAKATAGAGTYHVAVSSGTKLACGNLKLANANIVCTLETGVTEAVTVDVANSSFVPTTAPNGTHDYTLMVRV